MAIGGFPKKKTPAAPEPAPIITAFAPGPAVVIPADEVEFDEESRFLLMSTRDFGDWTGYVPRNPDFM